MKTAEKYPFAIYDETTIRDLKEASLIVGWNQDAGNLGAEVLAYLGRKLGARDFARIDLPDFFPLGGVVIEDDIVQFPEGKFYVCPEKDLLFFRGDSPRAEWYRFLNGIIDVGQLCQVKEIYTVGGMVSLSAHTTPRDLLAVANCPEMKAFLDEYGLAADVSYETPPHQRPTLSSYLLWAAQRRRVPGISLWAPTPFYLVSSEDPQAWKKVVEFFNHRFSLGIDLSDLDQAMVKQNEKIARLTARIPEIAHYLWKLERNLALTEEENQRLVKEMEEELRQ